MGELVVAIAGLIVTNAITWAVARRSGREGVDFRLSYRGPASWDDNFLKVSLTNVGDTKARDVSISFPQSKRAFYLEPLHWEGIIKGEVVHFEIPAHVTLYGSIIASEPAHRSAVVSFRDQLHFRPQTQQIQLPDARQLSAAVNGEAEPPSGTQR